MGNAILTGQSGGKKIKTQSKTVTPTASTQTVLPDENMLLDSVIVNGDSDLIPSNIKSGVSIFGVTGNVAPAPISVTYAQGSGQTIMRYSGSSNSTWSSSATAVTIGLGENLYCSVNCISTGYRNALPTRITLNY